MKKYFSFSAMIAAVLLTACGGSTSTDYYATATSATYKVEYSAKSAPSMGKNAFTVKVTRNDNGQAVTGGSVVVWPVMQMNMRSFAAMGYSHGAPVDPVTDNGGGSYSSAVYYIMEGAWTLEIKVNGETASFPMTIAKNGTDTPMVSLKGVGNDMVMGSTGSMTPRSYFFFNEGMEGTDTLMVFVATRQEMFSFPAVYLGQTMGSMTISSLAVEASQDGVTWTSMMDHGGGHYHAHGLAGLIKGTQATVHVRLAVNGSACTTDGAAVNGANGYQTMKVTP